MGQMSTLKVQFSFLGFWFKKKVFPKVSKAGTFETELKHFKDLEKDSVSKELPPVDKQRWRRQEKGSQSQPSQAKPSQENGKQSKARAEKAYHRLL